MPETRKETPRSRPPRRKATLVLETDGFVVVDKPAGLAVDPADELNPPLATALPQLGEANWLPVIPTEVDASGLTLLAINTQIRDLFREQHRAGALERLMVVMVNGYVREPLGVIDLPLMFNPRTQRTRPNKSHGQKCSTTYRVTERLPGNTLLECVPRGEVRDQVRVHLAAIGHPLTVDPYYGSKEPLFLSQLKPNYRQSTRREERPLIDRLSLHTAALNFTHPDSAERVQLQSELSKDLRATIRQLGRLT